MTVLVIQVLLVGVLAWLLDDFRLSDLRAAVLAGVAFSGLQALIWPVIYRFSLRWSPLLFPLLTLLASGGLVFLAAAGLRRQGVDVEGLGTGIWIALGLTAGTTLIVSIFGLDDEATYDHFVTAPLRRRRVAMPPGTPPGFLFLELDGLSEPVFRAAMANGSMPTLRRWVESGGHRLKAWETDLSAQTSGSQAGILLGDNTDIPAFRWYDKASQRLMVSSKMSTARALEASLSSGNGLLSAGGGSRFNVFSGDAPDCLCVFSTVGDRSRRKSASYFAYFSNPYTLTRSIMLYLIDVVRERVEARRQRAKDELPRIRRTWSYAFIRAATTTIMVEAGRFMLLSDMFRGVPSVYITFFAYDEVAHHSGIDRTDSFKVLRLLDAAVGHLERAAAGAPRPYHLVVVSDHGQSQGATFLQRYDQTLADLVRSLIDPGTRVADIANRAEAWGNLEVAVTQAVAQDTRTARLARRALNAVRDGDDGSGVLRDEEERKAEEAVAASDVVVLASGNLGLISFKRWPERATYEQLTDTFPALLTGLVRHPGVGFVLVRSETDGGLVIGADGIHYLDHGYAVGVDPLLAYGANAARHLTRTHGFSNAPDILVMSMVDPETGEVAAFEELVGSHGGLGGAQTSGIVVFPAVLEAGPEPIVGAGALHDVLKRWVDEAQGPGPAGGAPARPESIAGS